MNRIRCIVRKGRGDRSAHAGRWVAAATAVLVCLLPASPVQAAHSMTVTATGGLSAQAVLTFLFWNMGTDAGTYYVDWGDGNTSSPVLIFGDPGPNPTTWNHTYAAAGTYTVQLYKDSAPDGAPQAVTVPPDATRPIVSITLPAVDPSTTAFTPVTVSGTATDPESGITGVGWFNQTMGTGDPATGTTVWNASVPLMAGTNRIVITATNGVGLQGTDTRDVVYTPADTTDPVVTITFPASDPYDTNLDTITVSGIATDNTGVTGVTWLSLTTEQSGTAAGTTAWSAGPIALFAGTNDILITASDAAGNSGTDSVQVIYTPLDVAAPTVTVTTPTSLDTYQTLASPMPIGGSAADDTAVTDVRYSLNAGPAVSASGTAVWSVPGGVSLTPGVNTIVVTAEDATAKTGTDSLTVTYDPNPPAVTISSPTSGSSYITSVSPLAVGGTAGDGETSISQVLWSNTATGGSGAAAGTAAWTASGILLLAGTNPITITATDQLGNAGTDSLAVTYDTGDPVVTITSPTAAATYQTGTSPVGISGTATDALTPVTQVTWASDRGGSGTAGGTENWSIPTVALQPGVNVVTITAADAAGNTGTDSVAITFDADDPTVTITSPTTSAAYATGSANLPLGGTASDPSTSITAVTWDNDRGGSGTATGTTSWTVASVPLFAGTNLITVTATDELGHVGTDTLTVTYTPADVTDPTISITTPTAAPIYSALTTPITIGGTAADDTAVIQVLWANDRGGSGAAAGTAVWSIPAVALSLGSNVVTVTAWDAANNTAAAVLTVDYSPPDLADPTVTVTNPGSDPAYTSAGVYLLSGTAADDISLVEVRWVNDRGGSGTATGTSSWTATVSGLAEGANLITVTAEDWTGKTGTDTVTLVYDPVAPVVTINAPTGEATLDTASPAVDLAGTCSDNLEVVQVLWANDRGGSGAAAGTAAWSISGLPLQPGQNVITITATDAAGNAGIDILTINPTEFTGPSFAGSFFVGRLELRFVVKDPDSPGVVYSPDAPGQATVPRNFSGLGVEATVTYNASGILRARWLVDGQVLGVVTQPLLPGRSQTTIAFPGIPGLPTYDAGVHRVEMEIVEPAPAFDEPVISYFVTAGEAPEPLTPLRLLHPEDNATAPLAPGSLRAPNFRWQGLGPDYTYRIELSGPSRQAVVRTPPGGRVPPVVIAETPLTNHNLSWFDVSRLIAGPAYTWQVTARRGGKDLAGGGPRTVFFRTPVPLEDALRIDDLGIHDEQGQPLTVTVLPQGEIQDQMAPMMRYLAPEPQSLTMVGMVVNDSGTDAQNLRVEFTVDDQVVDASFLSYLAAGAREQLTGVYELADRADHNLQVRVVNVDGNSLAAVDAQISGDVGETGADAADGHIIITEALTMTGFTGDARIIDTPTLAMTGFTGDARIINTSPLTMTGLSGGARIINTAPLTMTGW